MGTEFGPSPEEMGLKPEDLQASPESKPPKSSEEPTSQNQLQKSEKTTSVEDLSLEQTETVNRLSAIFETNWKLLKGAASIIKEHPVVTGTFVSAGLGALSIITETPIPPDILSKVAAGIGGASFGLSRAPEGSGKKLSYAIGGAVAGAVSIEGAGYLMDENTAGVAANFIDDIPTAASGAIPVAKKMGEVGKDLISKRSKT